MPTRNVAILLFPNVELLDFCGPYEVFSIAARQTEQPAFRVYTVAESVEPIASANGLSAIPDFSLTEAPPADLLLVPGGIGTRKEIDNVALLDWIRNAAQNAELVLSVCTGALLLGKAGLLDSLETTTHHVAHDLLREIVPSAVVHEDRRFVDNGRVITSAGIAAGIDMSLHVVRRLLGDEVASATAKHLEYPHEQG